MQTEPILRVEGLRTTFSGDEGTAVAVDDVSFDVNAGEIVGLIGESGSGKSVTALAIMGLLPKDTARVTAERILFDGHDLVRASEREMRRLRGRAIGMIFQEPMSSLNPVLKIGDQLIEPIRIHERISHRAAFDRGVELLSKVGIPSPIQRMNDYPHQLSGGMRQRVMIAIALSCSPKLLLADEPTTALDVTIQAQLLDLLLEIQSETKMAIVLITHSMGVIAECADKVVVMYSGRIAEQGPVTEIFDRPGHPYTKGLMQCTPELTGNPRRLTTIPGSLPSLSALPPGCRFAPRCGLALPTCEAGRPPMIGLRGTHASACIRADELVAAAAQPEEADA
ncbi:ABC transporter ATP-binding protein [Nitratireductor soli]|uniref:ABC transporter ATP-binding protein n=1 Tax=Nitratireductor soli TaxID=1670619 RepID=UPI00065DEB1A|nr:ABC transporter ATP-binding protein [Nitratireductor soli]